ncbi:MAG: ABC transporter permease [Acidobacteria bacterium]|nr:ABC transporter permease [Acidobacteriota bacterium]
MRDAFRSLSRSPLFALPVVLLLALSIGANTLVFTAIHALLLKPLPVREPATLYRLGMQFAPTLTSYTHSSIYADILREHTTSFASIITVNNEEMPAGSPPEHTTVAVVSPDFFPALGIPMSAGHGPVEDGEAVVSAAYRDRHSIDQTLLLRGKPYRVVGVVASQFTGIELDSRADIYVTTGAQHGKDYPAQILVRLRPGVTLAQAEAEVKTVQPALLVADAMLHPNEPAPSATDLANRVTSLQSIETGVSTLRKTFRGAVSALLGGVVALLLLVCANAGGLMAARAQARQSELALRLSLGATRDALVRHALCEAFLLSLAGAIGGLGLASAGAPLLTYLIKQRKPLGLVLTPDLQVFAYAALTCLAATLLLALLPALQIVASHPAAILHRGTNSRVAGAGPRATLAARGLVIAQVALATLLALGGVSLYRTLDALRHQDPGFRTDHLIVLRVLPEAAGFRIDERPAILREAIRRTESIPGVQTVAVSQAALLRGIGMKTAAAVAGQTLQFANAMNISLNAVSANYFEAMRMPLLAGRPLRDGDRATTPQSVVVTEALAKQFFGGTAEALGKVIGFGRPGTVAQPSLRIAGVVRDARYRSMREVPPPTVYGIYDTATAFAATLHLVIAPGADTAAIMREVRQRLNGIGQGLAPVDMAPIEREIEISLWQERLLSTLASGFAIFALLLAGIGLFGLLAYSVSRRTREFGVRMALGADPKSIASMISLHGLAAVIPGLSIGLALYFALARIAFADLLFGVTVWDPWSLAIALSALLFTAASALALPVFRAATVDPASALRAD